MHRLDVPELEDQPWFPALVRDGATDWLRFMSDTSGVFAAIAPKLEHAFTVLGERRVLDLCSGGGGPWLSLAPVLLKHGPTRIELSDLYPNTGAFAALAARSKNAIGFRSESVDATNVPAALTGVRTIFNGFHHFPPQIAQALLQDAVRKRQPIAVFEGFSHRAIGLSFIALQVPLSFLFMPLVRPFRWWRLALTYALPAIPSLLAFDGAMSMLRLYLPDELREMVAALESSESFEWDIGTTRIPGTPFAITHLLGVPKSSVSRQMHGIRGHGIDSE